jgi:hypothetical protein
MKDSCFFPLSSMPACRGTLSNDLKGSLFHTKISPMHCSLNALVYVWLSFGEFPYGYLGNYGDELRYRKREEIV